jgi:microcystin-dependent protein
MSCTASDLINIQPLVLSDTFNTWFDRTNEMIEAASAINVFDVDVGATSGGLIKETGCSGGYYNGVVTLSANPGAGIGIGVAGFTDNFNKIIIDAVRLEDLGTGASANPQMGDYVIFSDVSDTRQGLAGTPKRTPAHRMLPPVVTFGGSGNGSFTIQGDVNIVGNLNVSAQTSYIDSNDLRIEDKIIELAYNRYVEFMVTGVGLTEGSFNGGQTSGMTAFYHDTLTPDPATATTIGVVRSWGGRTAGAGTTGTIQLHLFTDGGVDDVILGGKLVITGSAITSVLTTGTPTIGTSFFGDEILTPAGIDIKGASGDKTFLWNLRSPDMQSWNAFVANTNLGVTGSDNYILSSKFASIGYPDASVNNSYTYYGSNGSFSRYDVANQLTMRHSPTGAAGATFGVVFAGSTGPAVYPGVPVSNWIKFLNADQLDGAHSLTTATPWSIPVSLGDGRIHEDWLRADAIRKTFCQTNHGFAVGHALRFDTDGSLTFAKANTVSNAEALGIVESVTGNCFSLVTKGFISGLTATGGFASLYPLVTGNAYFLHPEIGGSFIDNPDSGAYEIQPGEIRKALLIATGINKGYVCNYTGIVVGDTPTDLVYLRSTAPIGAVQPFAGITAGIPDGWLLCDGSVKAKEFWNDLFGTISNTHYAIAEVVNATTFLIEGDTRGILVGDALSFVWAVGSADGIVSSVNTTTRTITVTTNTFTELDAGVSLKVYGRVVATAVGRSIFFLPDLRRRTVFGVSNATGLAGSGIITPPIGLGTIGGESEVTLLENNIPPHTHTLNSAVQTDSFSNSRGSSTTETGGLLGTGAGTTPFDIIPPNVGMHWIIRAKNGFQATILTGHNHDNFYIRYNINHTTASGAARTLTDADRAQFRTNAKVLRNDADDTFHGALTVTGTINIQGLGGADSVDAIVAGGVSADFYVGNRLFINESARISLPSSNSLMITGSSTSSVRMYPALNYGLTGATKLYDQNQKDADSRNVVVDYSTGEVSCRPMFNVSTTGPSTAVGYPEGFVWYETGTPTVQGNVLAAEDGWVELPGGILMQWGTTDIGEDSSTSGNIYSNITFRRAFAQVYNMSVTVRWDGNYASWQGKDFMGQYTNLTNTGAKVIANNANTSAGWPAEGRISWTAIGIM